MHINCAFIASIIPFLIGGLLAVVGISALDCLLDLWEYTGH
jgi:high-affinity K+ transport system ATPase subunit B